MTKSIRLVLAFLVMAAGVIFAVAASTAAQASPYGHPFTCHTIERTKPSGVTIVTLRCSGKMPDGTVAKYQCRQSPVAKPCKGPALPPTSTVPAAPGAASSAKVLVVLHSTPKVLGAFTANSKGIVNATVTIPEGFTGHHTIEARVVNSTNPAMSAPVISSKLAAKTTRVMIPITVGVNSVITRSAQIGTGSTDQDNWVKVAVVGVGALGVVMLLGGGLLMFTGRRRRIPA
jgi:hypothetical protein